jgi:hypothetical protein
VAIDGSGLPVCHDRRVNGDRSSTVLKGLTPCGVDPDDGLTCSSKRLQRTVTQNRHFNEQAEFVIRRCAHPDPCPHRRRSSSTDLSAPWRVCRCSRLDSEGQDDRCRAGQIGGRASRQEMSMSDVRESGVLDTEVDPAPVTLDDETLVVPPLFRMPANGCTPRGRSGAGQRYPTRGRSRGRFKAGVLCRPRMSPPVRPYLGIVR